MPTAGATTSASQVPAPAVSLGGTLAGGVRLSPGAVLDEVLPLAERGWSVIASSHWLSHSTFVPAKGLSEHPHIRARLGGGYQDEPSHARIDALTDLLTLAPHAVVPAPVINTRGKWLYDAEEGALHVYDSAAVIYGQELIAAYGQAWARRRTDHRVPAVVVDVAPAEEQLLYKTLRAEQAQPGVPNVPRYSLKISPHPVDLQIRSEPFVVSGRRGYSPMVIVTTADSDREHGLYVSAGSLTAAFESIRERRGSLVGARVRVSKESSSAYAQYVVEEI